MVLVNAWIVSGRASVEESVSISVGTSGDTTSVSWKGKHESITNRHPILKVISELHKYRMQLRWTETKNVGVLNYSHSQILSPPSGESSRSPGGFVGVQKLFLYLSLSVRQGKLVLDPVKIKKNICVTSIHILNWRSVEYSHHQVSVCLVDR